MAIRDFQNYQSLFGKDSEITKELNESMKELVEKQKKEKEEARKREEELANRPKIQEVDPP